MLLIFIITALSCKKPRGVIWSLRKKNSLDKAKRKHIKALENGIKNKNAYVEKEKITK